MIYTFRNDTPDEFLRIVQEVGQWLIDSGQMMWGPGTLTADNLIDDYTRNNCYVMYADGEPASTFILQWEDPLYYPDVPANTVGLIHKVAIRRSFAGQNLFQPMLDFCKTECLKRGIHEIQRYSSGAPTSETVFCQPTRKQSRSLGNRFCASITS